MKKISTTFSAIFSLLLMTSTLSGQVYVRSDGPNNGDGKSWETAFNSIDAALQNVQTNPHDTTIWIAAGIYSPITPYSPSGVQGGAAGDAFPTGLLTYDLPNGVKLYGGFSGDEKHLSDRRKIPNPLFALDKNHTHSKAPKTVVDFGLTVLDGKSSESWHVITVGNDIAKTGANVGLFDLTIRGGYADGPDSGTVDSIFSITSIDYAHDAGGGLYARFGSVVDIYNVQFISNGSSGVNATVLPKGQPVISGGGAIAAFDANTITNIKNSYFSYNSATTFGVGGGAINSTFEASLNVKNSIFTDNVSNRTGGAIRTKDAGDTYVQGSYFARNISKDLNVVLDESAGAIDTFQGNLFISNSTFITNQADVGGGAIFFHTFLDDGDPYNLDVNHCHFEANRAGPFGGGAIFIFGQGQHAGSKAIVRNSKFAKNSGGLGGAVYASSYETEIRDNSFTGNHAEAWGGAIAVDNFGEALLFSPLSFEKRQVTKIKNCTFNCNKITGVQPAPFGYPPFFTTPQMLNIFAILAPGVNNINTAGTVDQTIVTGGGAVAVLLAGVAEIDDCAFTCNNAGLGTGGAILVGGATGTVTDLDTNTTYETLDYASAIVKNCTFKHNLPNNAKSVDLANVGTGPDGVTLIIKK